MKVTVNYYKGNNEKECINVTGVIGIRTGRAIDVLGRDDAIGNGIALNAPLVQLRFADGERATFDADNVELIID